MKFNGPAGLAALNELNISISAASRDIGCERSHLSNVLAGRRGAGAEMVKAFADLTGRDPMSFVGPEDPRAAVVKLARLYKVTPAELAAAS